ncbi:hypothetical protein [Lentibacillus saliphilus]|uniref:hypothetical protein n=1 Tax=Lentibacillus saliphilus TaxID=2737028 RepID=UPI001C2F111C|nr:hypothetical protein [Lentibacillus saliphilus]
MSLAKADFYFGALLSRLVKSGFAPAIIEEGEKRRIYSLANDFGDYTVYAKYASKPHGDRAETKRWDFWFSPDELLSFQDGKRVEEYIFAFVCGLEELKDSEIAFLTYEDIRKCIGVDYLTPNRRVSVKLEKGSWSFTVYGTGLDGQENPIKITRNLEKRLKQISTIEVNESKYVQLGD